MVTKAIEQYLGADPLKNLSDIARDKQATRGTRSKALRAIERQGNSGFACLTELGKDANLEPWLKDEAVSLAAGEPTNDQTEVRSHAVEHRLREQLRESEERADRQGKPRRYVTAHSE